VVTLRSEGAIHVRSAGSDPAEGINEQVAKVMSEVGVDLAEAFPKPLTDEVVRAADVVITMGCGDACPIYPGSATRTGRSPILRKPARGTTCGGSETTSIVACSASSASSSPTRA
jgi:protein-tyrosine-phosphatase